MAAVLVINTGSTSTKIAVFIAGEEIFSQNITVPAEILEKAIRTTDQLSYRLQTVKDALEQAGISPGSMDIISARGGPLPPIHGGAYYINQLMVDVLTKAPVSNHESALSCMIAKSIGDEYKLPAIIYDGISTDEMEDMAKYTGVPGICNSSRGHPLNARRAARNAAAELQIPYEKGCFIVAHLGGSISISAHKYGRIVDITNAFNGPMSPQRAGRLPTDEVIGLCYSGRYTRHELTKLLNGKSGFMGYFGTQDSRAVMDMAQEGNEQATAIVNAMAYQCAKGIAEMRIALGDAPHCIILTGGMAKSDYFTGVLSEHVDFLGPVRVMPGEFEMEALAEGAERVYSGVDQAREYDIPPIGYESVEAFYATFQKQER